MFTFEPPGVSPVPTPISSLSSLPLCPGCSLGLKPAKAFLSLPLLLAPTQQALSSQSSSTQQGNGLRRMSACVENTLSMLICELVGWHPNEMTFPQDQACKREEWGKQGRLFIPPPTCPMHQLLQIRINRPDRRRKIKLGIKVHLLKSRSRKICFVPNLLYLSGEKLPERDSDSP